jgi:uncharacterized protein
MPMVSITWESGEQGKGSFKAWEDNEIIGLMLIRVEGKTLSALHTEVEHGHEGKGIAHLLLEKMVAHARENQLQVIPHCPFVLAEFRKNSAKYSDIWSLGK